MHHINVIVCYYNKAQKQNSCHLEYHSGSPVTSIRFHLTDIYYLYSSKWKITRNSNCVCCVVKATNFVYLTKTEIPVITIIKHLFHWPITEHCLQSCCLQKLQYRGKNPTVWPGDHAPSKVATPEVKPGLQWWEVRVLATDIRSVVSIFSNRLTYLQ